MDIQRKCFEESNNVNPDWSFKFNEELQQYIALDSEMELQVDEFNELWDAFRAGWQAAKVESHKQAALYQSEINHLAQANQQWREKAAQAIPDGFVVVPRKATKVMLDAGYEAHDGFFTNGAVQDVYVAMIEAQEQK